MDIEIRRAGPTDAAALALIGQATTLETYSAILTLEDMLAHTGREHGRERYAEWLADPAFRIWVAERPGVRNLVGYVVPARPSCPCRPGRMTWRSGASTCWPR
jgi:hypothetical protein